MNTFLFKFTFFNPDDTTSISVLALGADPEYMKELIESESYAEFVSESVEDYGVHDLSYNPDYYLIGYNSTDIKPELIAEVMKGFGDFFENHDIEIVDNDGFVILDYEEDTEVEIAERYVTESDLDALQDIKHLSA